jgi:hypothetical protein
MKVRFYLNGQLQKAKAGREVTEEEGKRQLDRIEQDWRESLETNTVNRAVNVVRLSANELLVHTEQDTTLRYWLR